MGKEEINSEVHHDDNITPYTAPAIPEAHLDKDEEVCSQRRSGFRSANTNFF